MEAPYEDLSTRLEIDAEIIEREKNMEFQPFDDFIVPQGEPAESCPDFPMEPLELQLEEEVPVSKSINPAGALEELRTKGNLKLPTIILSIFTDVEDAFFDDDVKHALDEGLAKINDATSMWLLISPKETAVSKLTVRAFVKTCDREKLDKSACIGIFTSPEKQNCPSATNFTVEKKKNCLENRYTHILRLGPDCKFHPTLEELLATFKTGKCTKVGRRSSTPVVSILVHGGVEACKKMKESMEGYPCIPVVIVKGSGGLADVIVDALAAYNKLKKKGRLLRSHIEYFLLQSSLAEHSIIVHLVKDLVETYSHFIIVYDHKRDPYGLHRAVIESCKGKLWKFEDITI
ncbi:transient receptor potential cation channel trpm-like [Rhopilema esculentum]|uniref:transient receptor potential cation channel trpm-like n=1 Tax=Rhopilema esculentum TaxID=499914 RepID=UPI0031D50466